MDYKKGLGNHKTIKVYKLTIGYLKKILTERLTRQNRLFKVRIDQIDLKEKKIWMKQKNNMTMGFNKLVNTLPFVEFYEIAYPDVRLDRNDFGLEPSFVIQLDNYDIKDYLIFDADIVNFTDEKIPWDILVRGQTDSVLVCYGAKKYHAFWEKFKDS